MRFDKMTIKLQDAIAEAQSLSERERQQALEPEHLLLCLLREPEGVAHALLKKLGVNIDKLIADLEDKRSKYPQVSGASSQVFIAQTLKEEIDRAFEEARLMKDEFVSSEHIILAVADNQKASAGKIFKNNGVKRDNLLKAFQEILR